MGHRIFLWRQNLFLRLFLLFTLVPLADLVLLIMISKAIPTWASITLIIGSGILGAWLAKRQWANVKSRIQNRLQQNEMPSELISDGMLILLAGGLLIAPGLITDALGMSLLIPVCRRWYKKKVIDYLKEHFRVKVFKSTVDSGVVDGEVVDGDPKSKEEMRDSNGHHFESPLPIIDGTVKKPK